ncbi:SDR family oxidoreductase [Psychrobium sp. 1_MG-2023]|uniref:SDR family NAD(P)-dependent oxidoreductase n=1 Tax=Psychrobium sp. 1_MG-2023 TaxID=3062624 RepID=UPI000C3471F4|nr:SDR family oxidoreductase [Psychrobium sp. 1_MG-2023]MDP2562534.1 SDR family NAD(P)-dependent oxidoreductase [Psychrobium sp. 1_MG-2023]PKF57974.1 NAD(P)-dependent oxidoreductase [Alteromonadales bacterium alter-6D02]
MKPKLLITGGQGDLSQALKQCLSAQYDVFTPGRDELDVTNPNSVEQYFEGKSFDAVINNAGTLYSSLIADSEPSQWINDINVNLIGSYLTCRFAIAANPKVKIINVASTAAYASYKDWSSYCCSKAGVLTFSHCLNNDGYEVYCLCPGAIDTKLRDGLTIANNNVMTLEEAVEPFKAVFSGEYTSGDVIFYRKNHLELNP